MAIGVYDSGIGGLTVYKAVAANFKKQDLIYLGDVARVPYGNRSKETIIRYNQLLHLEFSFYFLKNQAQFYIPKHINIFFLFLLELYHKLRCYCYYITNN